MKKLMVAALVFLSILTAATGLFALTSPVASVNGTAYDSLQEAVDAAARGQTQDERAVLLLADVDLGGGSVVIDAGDVTLDLNGHTVTGTAQALIVLEDGARLAVTDEGSGCGAILCALEGAGCAIRLEGGSSLVVEAGTIDARGEDDEAVRCGAGSTVVVNGGSVDGIARAKGAAEVRNEGEQNVLQYDLTIGDPPMAGAEVAGLSTIPGLSYPYGPAFTGGEGVVHVWLPEGQTWITVQIGCAVYAGEIHGENPYTATLSLTGYLHDFPQGWLTDAADHWKSCRNCGEEAYRAQHAGGEATCTEPAVCPVCGVPCGDPLGHDFEAEFTIDIEPTCTEPGSKSRHCSRCDEVTDVTPIDPTGHRFSKDWSANDNGHWRDAICGHDLIDEGGPHNPEPDDGDCTTEIRCAECGFVTTPAKEHLWSAWYTSNTEHWHVCEHINCAREADRAQHGGGTATCTEQAVCEVCGKLYGAALGHDFEEIWSGDGSEHWHACTRSGCAEASGRAAHSGGTATCTEQAVCEVCGKPYGAALGHDFEAVWSGDGSEHWHACTRSGCAEASGRAAHSGGTATCTEQAVCEVCGKPYGALLPHDFEADYATDVEATCTEAGSKSRHCANCGAKTDVTEVPPRGHTYSASWSFDLYGHYHKATCEHGGGIGYAAHIGGAATCTQKAVCAECGAAYGSALGHSIPKIWLSDASEHWRACARAGCTETEDRGAHTGGEATCVSGAICSVCGLEYTAPLGHAPDTEWTVDTAATCTTPGSKSHHCTRTGCTYQTDVTLVDPRGHAWGEWTTVNPATCTAEGLERRVCLTGPAHAEERAIPIDPNVHDWGEGVVTTQETCVKAGVRTFTCAHDAAHTKTESIPSSAHTHTLSFNSFNQDQPCALAVTVGGIPLDGGDTALPCGTRFTVTAAPAAGYTLRSLEVNGMSIANGSTQTLMGGNMHILAWVDPITYGVTFVKPDHGTISPAGTQTVNHGSDIAFTIAPDTNYGVRNVYVDGVPIGAAARALTSVTASHTVTVDLARVYGIAATTNKDRFGQISPAGTTDVLEGGDQTYAITPAPGCKLTDVLVDDISMGPITSYTFTNVTRAHKIRAVFEPDMYRITVSATTGGIVTPPQGISSAPHDQSLTVTMTPDTGYMIYDVKVDDVSVGRPESYTFGDNCDHTIHVEFRLCHTITTRLDTRGGGFSPAGPYTAWRGETVVFTVLSDTHYVVDYLEIDGTRYPGLTSCTFKEVKANHTIAVGFIPLIHAYAGTGGAISPSGGVKAAFGSDQTFAITPAEGYTVGDVQVDGASVGAVTSYTFENIAAWHTISAVFNRITFPIEATAGVRGTISPAGTANIPSGTNQTYTIMPDEGFVVKDVRVDGASVGAVTSYTFKNVTAPHTIEAIFVTGLPIEATAAAGGAIAPCGITNVPSGGRQVYTITPDEGYHILEVQVDGKKVGPAESYVFDNVTIPHKINAVFAKNDYTISFADETGRFISAPAKAQFEDPVQLTVTPAEGWELAPGSVKVNGVSIGGTSFTMPAQNVVITAAFRQIWYTITIETMTNGIITASAGATKGTDVTLTVAPAARHRLKAGTLKVNGVAISDTWFRMPAANVTITAEFELNVYWTDIFRPHFVRRVDGDRGFPCAGPYSEFEGVLIDGALVGSDWYVVTQTDIGTRITFKAYKLDDLSSDIIHSITFLYTGGVGYNQISVGDPDPATL